jgi:hypothetical protein
MWWDPGRGAIPEYLSIGEYYGNKTTLHLSGLPCRGIG